MTAEIRTLRVGDVVYHDPAKRPPRNQGIPKRLDLGDIAWVITGILDRGYVRLREAEFVQRTAPNGIRYPSGPTTAVAKADLLVTAEELVARAVMA